MTGEIVRLDAAQVCARLACSRMTITRMVADGRLPAPAYLLGKRVWTLAQVETAEAALLSDAPPLALAAATARARFRQKETSRGVTREASAPGERCTSTPLRAGGTQ